MTGWTPISRQLNNEPHSPKNDSDRNGVHKRASWRTGLVLLSAIAVLLGVLFGPGSVTVAHAESSTHTIADGWVNKDATSVEVSSDGGASYHPYSSGQQLNYGDRFRMRLEFQVPNSVTVQPNDVLVYQLPEGIDYQSGTTYPMTDSSGATIGSYVIRDNQVVIAYTGTGSSASSNLQGFVTIDGEIVKSDQGDHQGGRASFSFPGYGTVELELKPRHDVQAAKRAAARVSDDPQSPDFTAYDFVIDVKSVGTSTNVVLADTMGEYLHLVQDSIQVFTDPQFTQPYAGAASLSDVGDHGFMLTVGKMDHQQQLYVKYRVRIDRQGILAACKENWKCATAGNPEYDAVNNRLTYSSDEDPQNNPSDQGIRLTSQWEIAKSGRDASVSGRKQIEWTIAVSTGDDSIVDGARLLDTLGEHLADPEGQVFISCYAKDDGNTRREPCGDGTVNWDDLKNGTATLPTDATGRGYGRYVITYVTPLADEGAAGSRYSNDVTVTPNDGSDPRSTTGYVTLADDTAIYKQLLRSEEHENGIGTKLHWRTSLTVRHDVESVTVTDRLDVDHSGNETGVYQQLDPSSIKVHTDTGSQHEWDGQYTVHRDADDRGFAIDFGRIPAGTVLYISYSSTVSGMPVGEGAQLFNSTSDGRHSSTASYTVPVHNNLLKEYDWDSRTVGRATWGLSVSGVSKDAKSIMITDTLPENMSYVEGSVKAIQGRWWPKTAVEGVSVADNGDGTLTFTIAPGSAAFEAAQRQGEPTSDGDALWIAYTTVITDYTKLPRNADGSLSASAEYTNSAHNEIDGVSQSPVRSTVSIDHPKLVEKSAFYGLTTAPNIHYTVNVNAGGLTLNKGRTLDLVDTLSDDLALRLDSVNIRHADDSEVEGATYSYDPDTRELRFHVPDATPCVISYKATVLLEEGEAFGPDSATNTVFLQGYSEPENQSKTHQTGKVVATQGGLKSNDHTLQVFKYVDGDVSDPLAGAQFAVEELKVDARNESGTVWTMGAANGGAAMTVTSGSNGYTAGVALRADRIYRVTESPMEGFIAADPYYVVFPGNDGIDYGALTLIDSTRDNRRINLRIAVAGDGKTLASTVWMCNNDRDDPQALVTALPLTGGPGITGEVGRIHMMAALLSIALLLGVATAALKGKANMNGIGMDL